MSTGSQLLAQHRDTMIRRCGGRLLLWACLLGQSWIAAAAWAEEAANVAEREQQSGVTAKLEAIRSRFGIPALFVGKFHSDGRQTIAAVGVRKAGSDVAAQPSDTVHLGSCTKAMTAVLLAQEVTAGRLRWEMTLAEALPQAPGLAQSQWASVTLAELMRHRSGMPANAPWQKIADAFPDDAVAGRRAVVKWLLDQKRPDSPGFLYSNVGYAVLGHVIETHQQAPWEAIITQRLFKPLAICDAGFGPVVGRSPLDQPWGHVAGPASAALPASQSQQVAGASLAERYRPVQSDNPVPLGPAGRVHMPLEQWAKFVAVFADDAAADPRLNVDQASWRELLSAGADGDYAGGWLKTQRRWAAGTVLTHAGSNTTWYCVAWVAPKKSYFVLAATNCYGDAATNACDQAVAALLELE